MSDTCPEREGWPGVIDEGLPEGAERGVFGRRGDPCPYWLLGLPAQAGSWRGRLGGSEKAEELVSGEVLRIGGLGHCTGPEGACGEGHVFRACHC